MWKKDDYGGSWRGLCICFGETEYIVCRLLHCKSHRVSHMSGRRHVFMQLAVTLQNSLLQDPVDGRNAYVCLKEDQAI